MFLYWIFILPLLYLLYSVLESICLLELSAPLPSKQYSKTLQDFLTPHNPKPQMAANRVVSSANRQFLLNSHIWAGIHLT